MVGVLDLTRVLTVGVIPPPSISQLGYSCLELVPQRELHDSRIRQQARVVSKARATAKPQRVREQRRLHVEPHRVRHVEHFPPELQALRLAPRHLPTFRQAQVQTEVASASYL